MAARDYLGSDKWKFGTISKILGKLHYEIKMDDGKVWKRHVDQMRKIGGNIEELDPPNISREVIEEIPTPTPTTINTRLLIPDSASARPGSEASPLNQHSFDSTEDPVLESQLNTNSVPDRTNDQEVRSSETLRRSSRIRKEPERMKDYLKE